MQGTSSRIVLPLTRKAVWELNKNKWFLVPKKRIPRMNVGPPTLLVALSCAWVHYLVLESMTNQDMVCWGPRAVQLASSPPPPVSLWTIATYSKNKSSYNQTASHMRPRYTDISSCGLLHNGSGCHHMFKWNHEKWWNCVTWSGNLSAR
jgi:hypothetical protein